MTEHRSDHQTASAASSMAGARGRSCPRGRRACAEHCLPASWRSIPADRCPAPSSRTVVRELWLEVGFGAGEHLVWQAGEHPDIGLIGAEPYEMGVAKIADQAWTNRR